MWTCESGSRCGRVQCSGWTEKAHVLRADWQAVLQLSEMPCNLGFLCLQTPVFVSKHHSALIDSQDYKAGGLAEAVAFPWPPGSASAAPRPAHLSRS